MELSQELSEYAEKETQETFSLQNKKLLRVMLSGEEIQARVGSMVMYQGDLRFEHAGSGGISKFIKKKMTGEGAPLMKVGGRGEAYLADQAQDIHLIHLDNDRITANGANLLAFDAKVDWDIKRSEGIGGMMAGGYFNVELSGTGWVALLSDGEPMLVQLDGTPTFADPQAAITWSSGVSSTIKADVNLKSMIGKTSGEEIQIAFSGQGWVLIQPSEGRVKAATTSTNTQSQAADALGGLFNR